MQFPTWEDWLRQQEAVYAKFRAARQRIKVEGIIPDPATSGHWGGRVIIFRPAGEFTERLSEVSRDIGRIVPGSVGYGPTQLHTTISDSGVVADYCPPPIEVDEVAKKMERGVGRALAHLGRISGSCEVVCGRPLVNATTVIMAGQPNDHWLTTVRGVLAACHEQGLDLRAPWGAHLTIARFGCAHPPTVAQGLVAYLDAVPPFGTCSLAAIEVCTFQFGPTGLSLTVHCRFAL